MRCSIVSVRGSLSSTFILINVSRRCVSVVADCQISLLRYCVLHFTFLISWFLLLGACIVLLFYRKIVSVLFNVSGSNLIFSATV